jgi:hypothetical protein
VGTDERAEAGLPSARLLPSAAVRLRRSGAQR